MSKQRKGQFGFFDLDKQLDKIYQINDFLPKLNSLIDWEMFRPILSKVREPKDPRALNVSFFSFFEYFKCRDVIDFRIAYLCNFLLWSTAIFCIFRHV